MEASKISMEGVDNQPYVGQKVKQREPSMRLESRPQTLFSQYGQKRFERTIPEASKAKFPRGSRNPSFILCPSCNGQPNDYYYVAEGKRRWRIVARCFRCGPQTLPFLPHLAIPVKVSKKRQMRARTFALQKALENREWYGGDSSSQTQDIDTFLETQKSEIDELLDIPLESKSYFLAVRTIGKMPNITAQVMITNGQGDVLFEVSKRGINKPLAELLAIKEILQSEDCPSNIMVSSKFAFNWVNHKWQTKHDEIRELVTQITKLRRYYNTVEFVPEWQNLALAKLYTDKQ